MKAIEVFIVVVICLIVYSLMPRVSDPTPARRLQLANKGRSIAQSIMAESTVRKSLLKQDVWARPGKFATANEYFAALLATDDLPGISFATFAGGGVTAAPDAQEFRTDNHNIWNVVAGLDYDSADELPFLFSKNFSITTEELKNADPNDNSTMWRDKIKGKLPKIGNAIIVVSKGSGFNIIEANSLTPSNFLNGTTYPGDIEILNAVD